MPRMKRSLKGFDDRYALLAKCFFKKEYISTMVTSNNTCFKMEKTKLEKLQHVVHALQKLGVKFNLIRMQENSIPK